MSLQFDHIQFREGKDGLEAIFMRSFSMLIPAEELRQLGRYEIKEGIIRFPEVSEKKAGNKLSRLLRSKTGEMRSLITNKPVTYVTRESGIPLIGNAAFGIVDRNSTLIEVKPVTGCNMNCVFCSVDEGLATKKAAELVIDPHYLAEECRNVVAWKGTACHITINAHGEPLTYGPMPLLISLLREEPLLQTISLITNGTLLTEQLTDALAKAGLSQLNISLNAIDEKTAKMLEGHGLYDVSYVKKMARYAAKKLNVLIAPVYVPGYNDAELKKLILFAKEIGARTGIQNFLQYTRGRNPVQSMPMEKFYDKLRLLEQETGEKLIVDAAEFGVSTTRPLPKPLRKGQHMRAMIACAGRYPGERIAVARERSITIQKCTAAPGSTVTVRITGDKHNIFYGTIE